MRLRAIALLCCMASVGSTLAQVKAAPGFDVDIASSHAELLDNGARIELAIRSRGASGTPANVHIELVDTDNRTLASGDANADVNGSKGHVAVAVVGGSITGGWTESSIQSTRVRYTIRAAGNPEASASGVFALSRIAPDAIRLTMLTQERARPGTTHSVLVVATEIRSARPVPGVRVRATLTLDADEDAVFEKSVVTDSRGSAKVVFEITDLPGLDGATIESTATRGEVTATAVADLDFTESGRALLISTDKNLYQPGQTIHTRVLVIDADRKAAAGQTVKLRVEDDNGETVFARDLTTSRFGVVSADVALADDAPLGDYDIEATIDNEAGNDDESTARVVVSRYDLPNFAVRVASDKSFYLPGESAKVTVSTSYLFGQPVAGGRARILEVDAETWGDDVAEDEDAKPVAEGTCGADGTFEASIDLANAMEELSRYRWSNFRDAAFVAEVTDPTTNRTERRRFDLRTSREPIHVTIAGANAVAPGHPASFFVITSLADGTMIPCDVTINEAGLQHSTTDQTPEMLWLPVATARTNRLGVARVRDVRLSGAVRDHWRGIELRVEARAADGRIGTETETIYTEEDGVVTVEPRRTILATGDPIEATVRTTSGAAALMVSVVQDGRILATMAAPVHNGRGVVRVPYRPEFRGRISVIAHDPTVARSRWDDGPGAGAASVLYPAPYGIQVAVEPQRDSYFPGETMTATVRVRDASGGNAAGVLAVAAVDSAVDERMEGNGRYGTGGLRAFAPWTSEHYGRIGDVTMSKLMRLDPTRRANDELDVVAAALMSGVDPNIDLIDVASQRSVRLADAFRSSLDRLERVIEVTFSWEVRELRGLPADTAAMAEALARRGYKHSELADPWGTLLSASSQIVGPFRNVEVSSAGPDTEAGTADDIVLHTHHDEYFKPMAVRISSAIDAYTGTDRYVRDRASFDEAVSAAGIDPDGLRDVWGRPYYATFTAADAFIVVRLLSTGPDGRKDSDGTGVKDDFEVSRSFVSFYAKRTETLRAALEQAAGRGAFPRDVASWNAALAAAGIDRASLVDQFGSEPAPSFSTYSRYSDRVTFEKKVEFGTGKMGIRTVTTPVTLEFDEVRLKGRGPDRIAGTQDDVLLARFTSIRSSMSAAETAPVTPAGTSPVAANGGGSLTGTVTDPQGAIIVGAKVRLSTMAGLLRETVTSGDGVYLFENLTPGRYVVATEAEGFMNSSVEYVPVYAGQTTLLDFELNIGMAGEQVMVTAGGESIQVNTESQVLETTVSHRQILELRELKRRDPAVDAVRRSEPAVTSTPRLRKYFPETVYWNPELVTDKRGRARIEFPLADSITTWQLSVLASTEDGRIALGTAEVLAFQPFFVDHDPPRVLTEGDRIGLPVVVRNYLDSAQQVDLSISPEPWFAVNGPASRRIRVDAGAPSRQIFDVRAVASVDDGPQRVTGLGERASDAIEKPVDVHPDGEERVATSSVLYGGTGALDVELPDRVLGSPRTKLKIYPSLMAHVVESVEGIMMRPYGCGEQTISSTYPSLMLLRRVHDGWNPGIEAKASKYLREGLERLKSYRAADGGIGYWTGSQSNTALTAYALQFVLDADDVVDVDDSFIGGLRDCLLKSQRADGSWEAPRWTAAGDRVRDAMETAYVAGALVRLQGAPKHASPAVTEAVRRGLAFVAPVASSVDEPYLTASLALAAIEVGEERMAADSVARLVATAHTEGSNSYWKLETNTPFCGWGIAGRVETTARVVRALARHAARYPGSPTAADAGDLVNRGTMFLLGQKDRYGVWYSTQATISVLDALLEQVGEGPDAKGEQRSATVKVDGRELPVVELPEAHVASEPIVLDLSELVGPGRHGVEITASGSAKLFAQVVARHYVPWTDAGRSEETPNRAEKREAALRLAVEYDRLDAPVGQPVTCTVTAERIGHRGYGMLVAEIGLPPGNDVDRSSLDRAVANSRWTVCRYDVLPDRVVVYLWPRAGGATFSFRFTTRYGVEAMAAPSTVWDYYNPESGVVLQPPRFVSAE